MFVNVDTQYLKLKASQKEYKQVVILTKLYPYCPGWNTSIHIVPCGTPLIQNFLFK